MKEISEELRRALDMVDDAQLFRYVMTRRAMRDKASRRKCGHLEIVHGCRQCNLKADELRRQAEIVALYHGIDDACKLVREWSAGFKRQKKYEDLASYIVSATLLTRADAVTLIRYCNRLRSVTNV